MTHVGGKGLDGVDAVVERRRHVADGAGEFADLVLSRGIVRNLDTLVDATAHTFGGGCELAQGSGDGTGK